MGDRWLPSDEFHVKHAERRAGGSCPPSRCHPFPSTDGNSDRECVVRGESEKRGSCNEDSPNAAKRHGSAQVPGISFGRPDPGFVEEGCWSVESCRFVCSPGTVECVSRETCRGEGDRQVAGIRADVLGDACHSFRPAGGRRVAIWIDRSPAIIQPMPSSVPLGMPGKQRTALFHVKQLVREGSGADRCERYTQAWRISPS